MTMFGSHDGFNLEKKNGGKICSWDQVLSIWFYKRCKFIILKVKGEKIHLEKCERGFEPFSLDFTTELERSYYMQTLVYI